MDVIKNEKTNKIKNGGKIMINRNIKSALYTTLILAFSFSLIMPSTAFEDGLFNGKKFSSSIEIIRDLPRFGKTTRTQVYLPRSVNYEIAFIFDEGTVVQDLNDNGQVVGWNDYGSYLWQNFTGNVETIFLGSLGGGGCSPYAINNFGLVVGASRTNYGDPYQDFFHHGFVLNPEDTDGNGILDLWFRDDDGNGVNDLMQDLGMTYLISPGGSGEPLYHPPTFATAINDTGVVVGFQSEQLLHVGWRYTAFKIIPEDTDGNGKPDLWFRDDDGNGFNDLMIDLGPLGEEQDCAEPKKINDNGITVGYSWQTSDDYLKARAVYWYNTGIHNLGLLYGGGNLKSFAYSINNLNQIVGESEICPPTGGIRPHAFIWDDVDGMRDLGVLDPECYHEVSESHALDINDRGQIVGYCWYGEFGDIGYLLLPLDTDDDSNPDTWYYNQSGLSPLEGGTNDLMFRLNDFVVQIYAYGTPFVLNERGWILCGEYAALLTPLLGDINADGIVSWRDIDPLVCAISLNEDEFNNQFPEWIYWAADCNQDDVVSWRDIDPFVNLMQ